MTVNNFRNISYKKNNDVVSASINQQKKEILQENTSSIHNLNDKHSIMTQDATKVAIRIVPFVESNNENSTKNIKGTSVETTKSNETNTLDNIVKDLSKYFDKSGKILASKRKELESKVLELLIDESVRCNLINKLGLNTPDNIDRLLVTMCVEADDGFRGYPKKNLKIEDTISVRENIFPLGATVINRYLSTAIIDATSKYAKTGNISDFKAKSFEEILTEPNQIAYGSTSKERIKNMINFMKNNSTYDIHRQVADELMNGKSNFEIRVKEKVKKDGKIVTIESKKVVNAGDFFHYASPLDKVKVINESLPWVKTPNGHRFSTYPPKTVWGQGIYFIGKNNGKDINWNK
jgi:hypothetical protein